MKKLIASVVMVLPLALTGCGEGGSSSQSSAASEHPAWVLAAMPEGALSVVEAKASAAEGDTIVLRGRIGGRKAPIGDDSPVFTVMDLAVPHCGEIPGDSCGTPWDYCCETPESLVANAATVRIVDSSGAAITENPTAHGLAALDEVIVVGTVAPRPDGKVLVVDASGVYRVPVGG